MRLYIGLVHFPVYNKNHEKIVSAITTLDIHDMARLATTYDVSRFFIVTPLDDQQEFARRVLRHWLEGYGGRYNRHRKEALECVSVVGTLEQAIARIHEMEGEAPLTIATDAANPKERSISCTEAREAIWNNEVVALLFGTAWGLHEEAIRQADRVLVPILGKKGYNHLSVRTAAAIILDRLAG
ncbi:MAG: RNA methyltransferase [Deltaproteobacteria bacterium]|nr:RNA methyltransferase [Deltaproteobacteria bacterium]